MDKQEIIGLLKHDMMGEHQAIIQYLAHAYAMGEGEIPCEIEAISRDEMRHLEWLAEEIVELGGDPSMERLPVDFSPAPPAEQLHKDIGLEQIAIDLYREHIAIIDDLKIQRLLGRILQDELRHQDEFRGLAEEAAKGEGMTAVPEGEQDKPVPPEPTAPARLAAILNQGVRHEYTVILQYLFHYFVAEDMELSDELRETAINEMQHMGWLSEELSDKGGRPDMNHTDLVLTRDMVKALQANIAVEQSVTGAYTDHIPEIEDPDVRLLLSRIRDHEIYHDAVFKDLLEEVQQESGAAETPEQAKPAEKRPSTIPSVGSLKKQDR